MVLEVLLWSVYVSKRDGIQQCTCMVIKAHWLDYPGLHSLQKQHTTIDRASRPEGAISSKSSTLFQTLARLQNQ